jgi:osmotically-inducible protein OsmY
MEIDFEIQRRVINELRTISTINANEIGVAVKNGIVTLSGVLHSYPAKITIERAVKKLANVKGIAQDIVVNLNGNHHFSDSEIANVAINIIEWEDNFNIKDFKILVEDAIVTLEGEVEWDFQRKAATEAIADITGVKQVINNIKFVNKAELQEIRKKMYRLLMVKHLLVIIWIYQMALLVQTFFKVKDIQIIIILQQLKIKIVQITKMIFNAIL